MFACVVPGRVVQQAVQVPEAPERFIVSLEDASALNHVACFMTGAAPFPEGYAATIHLETPGKGWQLIGSLSNAKPSAIFRLRGTFIPSTNAAAFAGMATPANNASATLGFMCEPIASVDAQTSALGSAAAAANTAASGALVVAGSTVPGDPATLAQRIGRNLFNALSGFAQAVELPDGTTKYALDFSVVEKWYSNFERKVRTGGAGFLMQDG